MAWRALKEGWEFLQKGIITRLKNFVAAPAPDPVISLEEAIAFLENGITKLKKFVEGNSESKFSSEEYIKLYTMVYNMLMQRHGYARQLYDWYRETIEEYLLSEVLPSIKEKHNDESMLRELVRRWSNHKIMIRFLSHIFRSLGKCLTRSGLSLKEDGLASFRELIYHQEIKDAVIALIKKEHEGKLIDRTLLENTLDILNDIDCYYFENDIMKDTTYYYVEAQSWTLKECHPYYMVKAEEYWKQEEKRHYLHNSDEHKLLMEIQYLLFAQHPRQLLEDQYKFIALLRGGKVEDLSMMYRLFKSTGHGQELGKTFRKHHTDVVTGLVKQAGASGSDMKVLLCEIMELYEKHAMYVVACFHNDGLFLKVLNDSVRGSLSVEFFATMCGNILKDSRTGSLCNEAKKTYQDMKGKVLDTLIAMIGEQRKCKNISEGEKIRMALLRNVLDMLHNIEPNCYLNDIVVPLLNNTKIYYSEIAPVLYLENPCPDDYMNKVDEFLRLESERASHYSPFDIKQMLYEEVTYVSLTQYLDALFQGDKKEDLYRLYVLTSEIWGSPKPIVVTFETHLKNKFEELVKEDKNSASNMENFAKTIIEQYDKYEAHVTKCFQGHASFYKAIRKAFKSILRTDFNGTLRAQLLTALCGNILKEDDTTPLSKEVIEGSLHKVERFLISIIDKEHIPEFCRNKFATILQEWFSCLLSARGDYISRVYSLFSTISGGQETFICMFEMHLMKATEDLVKQAKDLLSEKEEFVSGIIGLFGKYEECICFQRHAWFCEALQKALEIIFTDGMPDSSGIELLALFCVKNIVKNDCNENDLDKVLTLLPYISNKDHFAEVCWNKFATTLQGHFPFDKAEVLCRMYSFFSKFSFSEEHFAGMLKMQFANELIDLVKHAEDNSASNKEVVVLEIIKLQEKYIIYVKQYFQGHILFYKVLDEALEVFCNNDIFGGSSAALLANFCNYILEKHCTEELSDKEFKHALDKVVRLLTYIDAKDLFFEFYRKKLARRLLHNRSVNDVRERNVLNKLEQCYGQLSTSKIKCMFTDIAYSRDTQIRFRDHLSAHPELNPGICMDVTVLRTGLWPRYRTFHMKLPAEMGQCVEVFNDFYQQSTMNRKLAWLDSLGTCTVNANFAAKTVELIVTPCQAALLLLFNGTDRLSYPEIATQLSLPDDDVKPLLYSLSCAAYKILDKVPANGTVSRHDVFEVNSKFTDENNIIKIPHHYAYKKKEVVKDIHKDSNCSIEATIVRIMKTNKVMVHKQLVAECVKKLKFKPDVKAIKKHIDDLITREYLERDKDSPDKYKYIPDS